jgi:hypothetical protein
MSGALSLMNFITIVFLVAVSIHVYIEIQRLKEYDEMNELQLQNLVNDINYNNNIISKNNDKITYLN